MNPLRSIGLACFGLVLAVGFADATSAEEGRLEISAACASVGCFAGDEPGYPVTIASSGSYVLTSDLEIDPRARGIEIAADFVTLDLNGFRVVDPSGTTGPDDGPTAIGVDDPTARHGIEVRNGSIRESTGNGLDLGRGAIARELSVIGCGSHGLRVGSGSVVDGVVAEDDWDSGILVAAGGVVLDASLRRNTVGVLAGLGSVVSGTAGRRNFQQGIRATEGAVVLDNAMTENFDDGIVASRGSVVARNSASLAGGIIGPDDDGIECGAGCIVRENAVYDNLGAGLRLHAEAAYSRNTIVSNDETGVVGGFDAGGNHCAGPGVSNALCP